MVQRSVVCVEPTNPGQVLACAGLLAVAERLWPGSEGCFSEDERQFVLESEGTIADAVRAVCKARLHAESALESDGVVLVEGLGRPLRLGWWRRGSWDTRTGLKCWCGNMSALGVASALQEQLCRLSRSLSDEEFADLFDLGGPLDKSSFYLDARRSDTMLPLTCGFSTDAVGMDLVTYPAVDLLAWLGLEFVAPVCTAVDGVVVYEYATWRLPVSCALLPYAIIDGAQLRETSWYRFEVRYLSTTQKKHRAVFTAVVVS